MLKKFGYLFVFFLFARVSGAQTLNLPCWNKAECFAPVKTTTAFSGLREQRPAWHKSLDDITFYMRPDTDYSILFDNQKDRVPFIHTDESQKAVDELAGGCDLWIHFPDNLPHSSFRELEFQKERIEFHFPVFYSGSPLRAVYD